MEYHPEDGSVNKQNFRRSFCKLNLKTIQTYLKTIRTELKSARMNRI